MDNLVFHNAPGRYIPGEEFSSNYYTFLPDPLVSSNLDIKIDDEMSSLLCIAHRLLGRLEGMSVFLPNMVAVESILMHKEAFFSCEIDGITAPFYDILDISRISDKTILPFKNHIAATQTGLDKLSNSKYKNAILCDVHNVLTNMENSEESGQFRTKNTFLSKYLVATNMFASYNPTSPKHMPAALHDLEKFICQNNDFDPLIKTGLIQYQFETIHPFLTGSGQIARILSCLVLAYKKILVRPIICLSQYMNLNKVEYIDRIEAIHRQHAYEQWIKFFIKSIIFAAEDSLNRIECWLRMRETNLAKIEQIEKPVKAIKLFYEAIERFPIFDINTIASEVGISYNTGATALKILSDLQIVKQTNHMKRNRDYAYVGFLNCFLGEDELYKMNVL